MAWIAVSTQNGAHFWPAGLGAQPDAPTCVDTGPDALLPRGSLVIETRLPPLNRPRALVLYDRGGRIPLHLSLQALPGGGLVFVLDQDGEMLHGSINAAETGRADILRVTFSWDAPARLGRVVLERPGDHVVHIVPMKNPKPLRVADVEAIAGPAGRSGIAPDVLFLAVSTEIEPVGPLPSLTPDTPIATPDGYRALHQINAGDHVRSACGRDVPVLARVTRAVPAMGSFLPVLLPAPCFGLRRDIRVASFQRLVMTGSMVEYMFGTEAVLAPASHLHGSTHAAQLSRPHLLTYMQLLLPRNESLMSAGAVLESLNIGRMRRKPDRLEASVLAGYDRARLPEHACPKHRVLQPFEAAVLAEARAA